MPPRDSRRTSLNPPQRPYLRPAAADLASRFGRPQAVQSATAGIVRSQINTIYQQKAQKQHAPVAEQAESQPQSPQAAAFAETSHNNPDSPYDKTHEADRTTIQASQWKQYHSAWQDYYRQYYERYYIGEVYRMRQRLTTHTNPQSSLAGQDEKHTEETSDNDATFHALRSGLLSDIRDSADKVRSSQHFAPFIAGALTLFIFWFFIGGGNQFVTANVKAYSSPGSLSPVNIIIDPNVDIPVSNEPRLIIPKINVDVPVDYTAKPDEASQFKAMEGGAAWFGIPGANSRPGQVGNTVLAAHSSNSPFDPGEYKFVFVKLEQLAVGDTFYANYLGTRYTYSVTKKEVVKPSDVQKLVYPTDKPVMTLITCVPIGTAQNRLLVTAEQISPSPDAAEQAPEQPAESEAAAMPGNTPTILSRLLGN